MLDVGWPELLVIAIVMIVVVGPKDLPRMLRAFGRTTTQLRRMAGDFRRQFDEALREAELDDVKNIAAEARKLDPTAEIRKNLDPLRKVGDEIRASLSESTRPAGAAQKPATPAPDKAVAAAPEAGPAPASPTDAPQPADADKPANADKSSGVSS